MVVRADLSHAIDVYSEWVDACDEVANPKEKSAGRSAGGGSNARSSIQQSRGRIDGPEDDDDDDDLGGGGGYGYGGGSSRQTLGLDDDDDED